MPLLPSEAHTQCVERMSAHGQYVLMCLRSRMTQRLFERGVYQLSTREIFRLRTIPPNDRGSALKSAAGTNLAQILIALLSNFPSHAAANIIRIKLNARASFAHAVSRQRWFALVPSCSRASLTGSPTIIIRAVSQRHAPSDYELPSSPPGPSRPAPRRWRRRRWAGYAGEDVVVSFQRWTAFRPPTTTLGPTLALDFRLRLF